MRWTKTASLTVSCLIMAACAQPVPHVEAGRVERLEHLRSKFVDARHVDVWLPRDYSLQRRYAVLYMHDGQMLFDATTTWNKQAWIIQSAVTRLVDQGDIEPLIIVGIWNNGKYRHSEYFPQKFLKFIPEPTHSLFVAAGLEGRARADAYLRFIVEELKPMIDARYATRPDREHTFIMGSSMGGLISVYAICEYPGVFGAAAALSTHWTGEGKANEEIPAAGRCYLADALPDPASHRLYMDHGTTELDALYVPYQPLVDGVVLQRGYTDANFMSRVFEGAGHNERAWAERADIPLRFLAGTR